MNVFEAVKENVTARQAAEMYGIRVNRNGMASCIFHDGRHPSMKVDRRFHCFGCQADGDVIDLAARLYGLNNLGAAMKLAADFGISYDNKGRASPRPVKKKLSEELRSRQAEIQYYQILSDYNRLLEKWKTEYAPSEPGEEWHPLFVEALQKQAYTEYLLDILLAGTVEDKAALVKGQGKEVMQIGERVSGFAARHRAGRGYTLTGTDCR
ncbi:MAG: DNA primase [Acetatifactor sp.]|nr:DNA primase [Acetatifactor sp.]